MKFLQIKKHRLKEEQIPRILEMGVDFDRIIYNQMEGIVGNLLLCDRPGNPTKDAYYSKNIAFISDCYQSRPLIEIDGFCEFDVLLKKQKYYDYIELLFIENYEMVGWNIWGGESTELNWSLKVFTKDKITNLGSIFKPENQLKYPELYAKALTLI